MNRRNILQSTLLALLPRRASAAAGADLAEALAAYKVAHAANFAFQRWFHHWSPDGLTYEEHERKWDDALIRSQVDRLADLQQEMDEARLALARRVIAAAGADRPGQEPDDSGDTAWVPCAVRIGDELVAVEPEVTMEGEVRFDSWYPSLTIVPLSRIVG